MKVLLEGCRSRPLSGYLKSLGVLRIFSLQKDDQVRGAWAGDLFFLDTKASRQELVEFFMRDYCPTPLVSPWNGGGGFYPNDDKTALEKILSTQDGRFKEYASVIRTIRDWPEIPKPPTTVAELQVFLAREASEKGSSRKGKKLQDIVDDIESPPESLAGFIESLPAEKEPLRGKIAKKIGKEKLKDTRVSNWVKAIGKGITVWSGIQRDLDKTAIMNACRGRLPEGLLDWLDAAFALGEGKASFAPILGTGANDGRLEFSNNFMRRVIEVLLEMEAKQSQSLLESALFGTPTKGHVQAKIGFYDPGRAGGYNQGMGVEKKDFPMNPWDYVLLFEGIPVLAASVSRREGRNGTFISAPFTVRHTAAGYVSKGSEKDRNETWLPLWNNPATLREVRMLFGEGRSQLGKQPSRTGLDFARSVGTLGVDRGVRSFERYIYLERRGNNYVALPAGNIRVEERPELDSLEEIDRIVREVDAYLRKFSKVPASLEVARKKLDEALYSVSLKPSPRNFRAVVSACGALERLVAARGSGQGKNPVRPFTGLSPKWVALCEEGDGSTPEVCLAASLASVASTGEVGSIRSYLSGVDGQDPRKWGNGRKKFWYGNGLEERLSRLLLRRLMDAGRFNLDRFPLDAAFRLAPEDVMPFLEGQTDDIALEELLWGFLWIDWKKSKNSPKMGVPSGNRPEAVILRRDWALLKLFHTPEKTRGEPLRMDPRIGYLLLSDRPNEAVGLCKHWLKLSGLSPHQVEFPRAGGSARLLASLAFPVKGTEKLARLVLQETRKDKK
jgi:CRISPR-associated protein Csx17